MSINLDFAGKTVVVIGGTSGINRGIAECFAQHGARVAVASRSREKVDNTVQALQALGAEAMGFVADVRQQELVAEGLAHVADAFGPFDVVVSGAAGNFPAFANDLSSKGFRAVVDIDLMGTFHVMQAAYPHLRKPGASLINISAPQAYVPMEAQSHVCAAKAGVEMITRCLAMEWGPEGIRVNGVVPGPTDATEGMNRLAPTPPLKELLRDSVPLKRLGNVEDIGHMCLFLASPFASYVSGAIIPVDGGWSLGGASGLSRTMADVLKTGNAPS